ncbi:hypothetical protein BGZ54_002228 [Gamsiella multidivaricata]|nr:hypothetical protein BGZ54_002228 [Gamsiella multidivaricata]
MAAVCLLIAKHLPQPDLARACCVSRHWLVTFASVLWRSIHADHKNYHIFCTAFPRYSVYIRELRCSQGVKLDYLGYQCTQLVVFEAPLLSLTKLNDIKQVLESNRSIEDLSLSSSMIYRDMNLDMETVCVQQTMEILRLVAGMGNLRRLSLTGFQAPPGALEYLLEQRYDLRSLRIVRWEHRQCPGRGVDPVTGLLMSHAAAAVLASATELGQLEQQQQQQQQQQQRAPQRQLRSLHLQGYPDGHEFVLKIVRRTPLLEQLSLAQSWTHNQRIFISPQVEQFCQQLKSYCPCVKELRLDQTTLCPDSFKYLLSAFPRLRRFEALEVFHTRHDYFEILIDQESLWESLEEVRTPDYGFHIGD